MAEELKTVHVDRIEDTVARMFGEANRILPRDVCDALDRAEREETEPLAKRAIGYLNQNLSIASKTGLPICQDTGAAVVFCEVGSNIRIEGGTLTEAINRGVRRAYLDGGLRCSIVEDPLYGRTNTGDNTPAFVHISYVQGDSLRMIAAPKGFGSENMSALTMMSPSSTEEDIIRFVTDAVEKAGSNPCPPLVLGIGIGGTFDTVGAMAKHALLRPIGETHPHSAYAALEKKILTSVNALRIGAQGFGGKHTALAVHIETAPTHIAGLPVALCICCHACRRVEVVL